MKKSRIMLKTLKKIIFFTIIVAATSCGTATKLKQTTNELNTLKEISKQQAEKLEGNAFLIVQQEAEIDQLKKENIQYGEEARDCRVARQAIQSKFDAIEKALEEKGTSLEQIEQKIQTSLEKFKQAGIGVDYKNGLVHLRMPNDLMFNSGSASVGWEGKQALAIVAEIVNAYPGTSIYVVGNTDNVPYQSGGKDNWTLSTDRANAVSRVLIKDGKVAADRITSAGRASYHPIADNTTADGKWQNRRTDIIINPNLERLLDLPGL
jgi:chemotaxis protein MotB